MTSCDTVLTLLAGGLRCGEPQHSGPLTVVPLFHDGAATPYRPFVEALRERLVTVEEVNGGSVPELAVVNRSDEAVLLLEGEVLSGLRQTRTLNTTVLVPAHSTLVIPVSCVEQHRWGAARPMAREEFHAGPRVRQVKSRGVQEGAREGLGYRAEQGEVWAIVEGDLAAHGVASPTASYADLGRRVADPVGRIVAPLHPVPGQRGVLALAGGSPLALDVFDGPATLASLWAGLVGSYAADALVAPSGPGGPGGPGGGAADAAALVAALARGEASAHPAVGVGEVVFLSSTYATVSALVVGAALVHLAALWAPGAPLAEDRPRVGAGQRRSWFGESR